MTSIVYNIPTALVAAYRGRQVIVRSRNAAELIEALTRLDLETLRYVRLQMATDNDVEALAYWGVGVPVDIVMSTPDTQYAGLYQYAKLLDKHPVRVSLAVTHGFSKAVKVATGLRFAVRLDLGQPPPEVIEEMTGVLSFFLHHPSVTQPVEYFYSLLQAFYREETTTLWNIQEEDPALVRYVTDDGEETLARRATGLKATDAADDLASFVNEFRRGLMAVRSECSECEFVENCAGYFKWPNKQYACDGVKTIFHILKEAAGELKNDLSSFSGRRGAL